MFEKLELTRMAQSLAAHSGARLATIAGNIAQADTPGYKSRDLPAFADVYDKQDPFRLRSTREGHLIGAERRNVPRPIETGGEMAPNGNDVSLDLQMMKSVEVRQSHEMALAIYRSTSSILRTALGRNS